MPHCLRWGGMASLLGGLGDRFPQHDRDLPSKAPPLAAGNFTQDGFIGRHGRLAGFEWLDLPTLTDSPEEVRIPITRRPVKVVGQVSRGMRQALGNRPCALAIGTVAHQAVGLVELLAAGDRRRITPAGAVGVGIFCRGCFPPGVLVGLSLRRIPLIPRRLPWLSFIVMRVLAWSIVSGNLGSHEEE